MVSREWKAWLPALKTGKFPLIRDVKTIIQRLDGEVVSIMTRHLSLSFIVLMALLLPYYMLQKAMNARNC